MGASIRLLLCFCLMLPGWAGSAEVPPDVLVKNTTLEVLDTLQQDKSITGDVNKIIAMAEDKILPHFDFVLMSRMTMGRAWLKATDTQKTQFVKEFKTLLVYTYASALSKFRDQKVTFKPLVSEGAGRASVETEVVQSSGKPLRIRYSFVKAEGGWKIYDMVVEEISLVLNYRNQFANQVQESGMDSLIQSLVQKNAQLMAKYSK